MKIIKLKKRLLKLGCSLGNDACILLINQQVAAPLVAKIKSARTEEIDLIFQGPFGLDGPAFDTQDPRPKTDLFHWLHYCLI